MKEKFVVSASGGLTSMMMSVMLKELYAHKYDFVFIFANTGCENEETLEFVKKCDDYFNLNMVWVEAVTHMEHGKGVTHRITNFDDAYRWNQYKDPKHPYHAHIMKNGIPNKNKPQCSDRLKEFAIEHYKKTHGLKKVKHAIGMRIDEEKRATNPKVSTILNRLKINPRAFRVMSCHGYRMEAVYNCGVFIEEKELKTIESYSKKLEKYNLVYPLCDWFPTDKQDVISFWEDQPFNLELEDHEGNCVFCWKKSDKKLHLIAIEDPWKFEAAIWWEKKYQHIKPNTGADIYSDDGSEIIGKEKPMPRYFFRGHRSAEMIIGESKLYDAYALRKLIGANLDCGSGCSDHCESYNI